jgi:hypothetical protein
MVGFIRRGEESEVADEQAVALAHEVVSGLEGVSEGDGGAARAAAARRSTRTTEAGLSLAMSHASCA